MVSKKDNLRENWFSRKITCEKVDVQESWCSRKLIFEKIDVQGNWWSGFVPYRISVKWHISNDNWYTYNILRIHIECLRISTCGGITNQSEGRITRQHLLCPSVHAMRSNLHTRRNRSPVTKTRIHVHASCIPQYKLCGQLCTRKDCWPIRKDDEVAPVTNAPRREGNYNKLLIPCLTDVVKWKKKSDKRTKNTLASVSQRGGANSVRCGKILNICFSAVG